MNEFFYRNGELYCEDVSVTKIAGEVGTPFYLYSSDALISRFKAYDQAFSGSSHLICYAVKANSNLAVLNLLAGLGSGADIVSGGELRRALRAGIEAASIVYSGVGKTEQEIRQAIEAGILMFNVESMQELDVITRQAGRLGLKAPISFRVNPDVDPMTHPYISTGLKKNKFGLSMSDARKAYRAAAARKELRISGISCHIGSQLTELQPFVDAFRRIRTLLEEIESWDIEIKYIDTGGGLGIRYNDETAPEPAQYVRTLLKEAEGLNQTVIVEPGRSIAGNAGILVTRMLYTKEHEGRRFYIVDAGMNDLARPSLYQAYHAIFPVEETDTPLRETDVVGPICETGDFLARQRPMPDVPRGSLLAVMSAGAYGFTMSSNYNSRPRIPEVMVKGDRFQVVRSREGFEHVIRGERLFELDC
ncbi:MAG TPA: diaminopimelate decarboxylase [Thermodesulfobacteriaceae bacterium]|nr:diaminopimelate decarboxylase [Thermodesulfobacteriaceae bacterium]